jgi:hypothetical protein
MIRKAGDPHHLVLDGEVAQMLESADRDGPLGPLLDAVRPTAQADHGTVSSADGLFTASIPLDRLRTATVIDGRLDIADPPTRCWLVKDIVRVELTHGKQPDSIDEKRGKLRK